MILNWYTTLNAGDHTISGTQYRLIPLYSYTGGVLSEMDIYLASPSGGPTLLGELCEVQTNGYPGNTLTGSSFSITPVANWNKVLSGASVTLQPRTYYYLKLWLQDGVGSVVLASMQGGGTREYASHPTHCVYGWDGTTLSILAGTACYTISYKVGDDWYGNVLRIDSPSPGAIRIGGAWSLPNKVAVRGAWLQSISSTLSVVYAIRLWKLQPGTFIPGEQLDVQTVNNSCNYLCQGVMFSRVFELSEFAITIENVAGGNVSIRAPVENATGNNSRMQRMYPHVRVVTWNGSSWSNPTSNGAYYVPWGSIWIYPYASSPGAVLPMLMRL